jgi:hypothetical protein
VIQQAKAMQVKGDGITGAVLFLGSAYLMRDIWHKSFGTSLLPMVALGVLMAASAALVWRSVWRDRKAGKAPFFQSPSRFATIALGMLAFVVSIPFVGFYPATFVFVPSMAFLLGVRSPVNLATASVAFTAAAYLVFELAFQTPLPSGIIFAHG